MESDFRFSSIPYIASGMIDNPQNSWSMLKIGLALGGGAARGLSHLGVLEVLVEQGIPIHCVSGSSIGAIIGSMFAYEPDPQVLIQRFRAYLESELFDAAKLETIQRSSSEKSKFYEKLKLKVSRGLLIAASMTSASLFSSETLKKNMMALIEPAYIESANIRLGVIACDLNTGMDRVFTEGPLLEAVMASSAIPGIFPPVKLGEQFLIDGSWVAPVPCSVARKLGADIVIAVDITTGLEPEYQRDSGFEVNLRSSEITRQRLKNLMLAQADIVIAVDMMDFHWADFTRLEEGIERGRQAALRALPAIREMISIQQWNQWVPFPPLAQWLRRLVLQYRQNKRLEKKQDQTDWESLI